MPIAYAVAFKKYKSKIEQLVDYRRGNFAADYIYFSFHDTLSRLKK